MLKAFDGSVGIPRLRPDSILSFLGFTDTQERGSRKRKDWIMKQANSIQTTDGPVNAVPGNICRILSLDGGGAKGFYTLGVLAEIEALVDRPLCECFHLIFGTSTGAIIAALLARGDTVAQVQGLYEKHVPAIMKAKNTTARSQALRTLAKEVFGDSSSDIFKTGIGIVATNWNEERPMIFKAAVRQAHG